MIVFILTTLFAASAALAVAAIIHSWQEHGAAALAARTALRDCAQLRQISYRIVEPACAPRSAAQIIPLPFKQPVRRSVLADDWRAAA